VPADAKVVRTIDVVVPIGSKFATTTRFGEASLRVGGNVSLCPSDGQYSATIAYSDDWPIKPGELPKNCRGFATHHDLKPGEETIVAGLASPGPNGGHSLFGVTVTPAGEQR
jgi:hypothetical protein